MVALSQPSALTLRESVVDVEVRGELTRGMCVVDARRTCKAKPNVELATGIDRTAAREYIFGNLRRAS